MRDTPKWQRPIELPPEAMAADPAEHPPHQPARDIPLDKTQTVEDDTSLELPPSPPQSNVRSRGWLVPLLGTLVVLAISAELYRLISWSISIHPLLGGAFSLLTLLLMLVVGIEIRRGLSGSRQLRQVQGLQQQAEALLQQTSHGDSTALLHQLEQRYHHTALKNELQGAITQLDSSYNDREIIQYLSRHALNQADRTAQRCVQRYSVESGVMVALSPLGQFRYAAGRLAQPAHDS